MATLDLIENKKDNEIAKEFFKGYTTCAEISRKLYSIKSKSKTKTIGTVTRCYQRWYKKGYLDLGRVPRKNGMITAYKLNLNSFFEYAKERIKIIRTEERTNFEEKLKEAKSKDTKKVIRDILRGLKEDGFNDLEKKFLNYIFEIPETREIVCKSDNLFGGILISLEKICFYNLMSEDSLVVDIVKGFFTEDKRHLKKCEDTREQYEEFWRVAIDFLDNLTNKIKALSHFNDEEYLYLKYKTKINNYSNIPFAIPNYETEENKRKLLRRFEIVFYEKRKPTNEELLKTR